MAPPRAGSVQEVSQWLQILSDNNAEPAIYVQEQQRMQEFRAEHPIYTTAASGWVVHADRYWETLKPQIIDLFSRDPAKGDFTFVQWFLEYVRNLVAKWGTSLVLSRAKTVELTDALCAGKISPLSVSAALGLVELSRYLELEASSTPHSGPLMPPLLCAVLGNTAIIAWVEPPTDGTELFDYLDIGNRYALYNSISSTYNQGIASSHPLGALVGFIGASHWEDPHVFIDMVDPAGLKDAKAILALLQKHESDLWPRECETEFIMELLTAVYDATLWDNYTLQVTERCSELRKWITDYMREHNLTFMPCTGNAISLACLENFKLLLRDVALCMEGQDELKILERLCCDPRFDVNTILDPEEEQQTLLHVLVSADASDAVRFLVKLSPNLEKRDAGGRTPLMMVESARMLEEMIRYGADTRHVDHEGRNVWHFCTYTIDVAMLQTLWRKDPHTRTNLRVTDGQGMAPFAAGLDRCQAGNANIDKILAKSMMDFIIGLNIEEAWLAGPTPLAQLFTRPHYLPLIQKGAMMGLNFSEIDKHGMSALACLNLNTDPDVIKLVTHLTAQRPQINHKGQSPAEFLIEELVTKQRSENCSCAESTSSHYSSCVKEATLNKQQYWRFLTDGVLQYHDAERRCTWQRVCDVIRSSGLAASSLRCKTALTSLSTIIECLVTVGASRKYEEETVQCALYAFAGIHPGQRAVGWYVSKWASIIWMIYHHSYPVLARTFSMSAPGRQLIEEAKSAGEDDLIRDIERKPVQRGRSPTPR